MSRDVPIQLMKTHLKEAESIGEIDFCNLYRFHLDLWIPKNKKTDIPITEMTTSHIKNAINFIDENGPFSVYGLGRLYRYKLNAELKRRNSSK